MHKHIGVLGTGIVGVTLAKGLRNIGNTVEIGSRTGKQVDDWNGKVGTFAEVALHADIVILAVKGSAAESVVFTVRDELSHKVVIDTTNPIAEAPPDDGVLKFFTSLDDSLMERLQRIASEARFVKAFNSVGSAHMVMPHFTDGDPTMFICGNDNEAKSEVRGLLKDLGWESEDFGTVKSARAIEPLCMLWCIPGMLRGEWSHAFKMLKV